MKAHTIIGIGYEDKGEFITETLKLYYQDYPPPDGYRKLPDVAKSDKTKEEWEEYYNQKGEVF